MVYEYLMQFTNDPYVKETLSFLMTREIAHFQMFEAALDTIQPNFPPGTLQGDPRYSNLYFNMSNGSAIRGPWNQGETSQLGEEWQFVANPVKKVMETNGLTECEPTGTSRTMEGVKDIDHARSKELSEEVKMATPPSPMSWNFSYPEDGQMK